MSNLKTLFKKIIVGFTVLRVMRCADKAVNKILTAQVLLAGIQGQQKEETEIYFWSERMEDCMFIVSNCVRMKYKINQHCA